MVTSGVVTAQSDLFIFNVQGKGGHGARPHEAIDAVVIAGGLISAVQTLVARETNPVHPSVVTIGSIHAGSAPNIIAGTAVLEGTIRTTRSEVRSHLHEGLRRLAAAFSDLHGASVTVEIRAGLLPVVNTPREADIARRAASEVVGVQGVVPQDYPSMGAEDFSNYLQEIPGCYVRFGARLPNREYIPLHSPVFDIDENVLQVGAAFLDRVAREAVDTGREEA
jgi:hippurate hydrolase